MADMKEENWVRNTNPVREWLATTEQTNKTRIIENTLAVGDLAEDDIERGLYWNTIRNMMKTIEDAPEMGRTGRPSSRPLGVVTNVTSVKNRIMDALASIGEQDLFVEVYLPHGRTGGNFKDFAAIAENIGEKVEKTLNTAFDEGRWNGEMLDNGLTGMTAPVKPAKAEKPATSEVSEEE